jgi:hypothetical protein
MLAVAGCLKTVAFRTALQPDGRVERHVKVESIQAPDVDSDLILPPREGWQEYVKEPKRFEARGLFRSVADIPLDWQKRVNSGGKDRMKFAETSRSLKEYRRFDCALFATHEYTETIQDVTSAEQFQEAVEEFLALRGILYRVADDAYGKTYDFSRAKAHVEKEFVPRFRVAAAEYWAARGDKRPGVEDRMKKLIVKHFTALGVKLPDDEDAYGDAFERWLFVRFTELSVRRDGEKVTAEDIEELVRGDKPAGVQRDIGLVERFRQAMDKHFGSKKKADQHLRRLVFRLAGAYVQILAHRFHFNATVVMPGPIVESNGMIDGNEATWVFTHNGIFPYYRMTARSVTFKPANQRKGKSVISSAADALRLADEVRTKTPEHQKAIVDAIWELAATRSPDKLLRQADGDDNEELRRMLQDIGLRK